MKIIKESRIKRASKTRAIMKRLKVDRLVVYRSNKHLYAQIFNNESKVLTSASTKEAEVSKDIKKGSNIDAAIYVGKRIAEKATKLGIKKVAFDRSGYKYHGRVKAVAESARKSGLNF